MIAAFDVQYSETMAYAAAVVFQGWNDDNPTANYVASVPSPEPYEPGNFYVRELLPLLKVVGLIREPIDTYIIDGYCHLSADLQPGLGARLHDQLLHPAIIIGVAKNPFKNTSHAVELLRGDSLRPIYITSIGLDYADAARKIASMFGPFRIPKLLKAADQMARQSASKECSN